MQATPADTKTHPFVAHEVGIPGNHPGHLLGVLGLLILLGIASPNSIQPAHLLDFTRQAAALGIVATGQTIVMIAGGLDLSVGATVILVDVVAHR